jgi:hypothetical protein
MLRFEPSKSWFLSVTTNPVLLIAYAKSGGKPAASAISPIISLILASASCIASDSGSNESGASGPGIPREVARRRCCNSLMA